MRELLFLAHRIPYPPNKGDKIRSFNLLKHLAVRYRVHLGAFIDDPDDWRHEPALRELCGGELRLAALQPRAARLRSLGGFLTGAPLTLPYYRSAALRAWVRQLTRTRAVERIVVFSAAMAQFVADPAPAGCRRVIDFVDVDSDKWRQYAQSKAWPMSWLYRREGRRLLDFERACARRFDASVFVSAAEAALFAELAPESAARIAYVENGVDTDYFDPALKIENPYASGERALVFTGAMDYWANVDAVDWFARRVLPAIRAADEHAVFYIVGARPTPEVKRLAQLEGVRVTGAVADIRPYLAHSQFAVAPLRIARGVQNKVLEAMAMGKAVLATPAAMDGLQAFPALAPWVSDEPAALADYARRLLAGADREAIGRAARAYVLAHYNWRVNLARFVDLLEGKAADANSKTARAGA